MTYKIQKRRLDGVHGEASWPIPDYSYQEAGTIEIESPIHKGDQVYGKKVIEVKHEKNESTIVISD